MVCSLCSQISTCYFPQLGGCALAARPIPAQPSELILGCAAPAVCGDVCALTPTAHRVPTLGSWCSVPSNLMGNLGTPVGGPTLTSSDHHLGLCPALCTPSAPVHVLEAGMYPTYQPLAPHICPSPFPAVCLATSLVVAFWL